VESSKNSALPLMATCCSRTKNALTNIPRIRDVGVRRSAKGLGATVDGVGTSTPDPLCNSTVNLRTRRSWASSEVRASAGPLLARRGAARLAQPGGTSSPATMGHICVR
jgi:UDP-N-acetylglucosamine enolpyruvyl transferase